MYNNVDGTNGLVLIGCLAAVAVIVYACIYMHKRMHERNTAAAAAKPQRMPLGQVLLKAHFITDKQLKSALAKQAKQKRPIGQVLLNEKMLDAKTMDVYLRRQLALKQDASQAIPLIGELLREAGIITDRQLNTVIAKQKRQGGTIGEHLIAARCTDEEELALCLKIQQVLDMNQIKPEQAQLLIRQALNSNADNLGSILADCGIITPFQRNAALEEQRLTGALMGDILVNQGFCAREWIDTVVSIQALGRGKGGGRTEERTEERTGLCPVNPT